jgi:hypothetical protein
MSERRKRGRPIKVPPDWLDVVRAYKDRSGKNLKTLGAELAALLGVRSPLPPARLSEYMNGTRITEEMTRAWATLMGVPMPDVAGDDPEMRQWIEVGEQLKQHTPDKFRRELHALQELVDALDKHSRRK